MHSYLLPFGSDGFHIFVISNLVHVNPGPLLYTGIPGRAKLAYGSPPREGDQESVIEESTSGHPSEISGRQNIKGEKFNFTFTVGPNTDRGQSGHGK